MAYAYITDANRNGKLSKKAEKLHFIGYSLQTKGYHLIDEDTLRVGLTSVEFDQNVCSESKSFQKKMNRDHKLIMRKINVIIQEDRELLQSDMESINMQMMHS